MKKQNILLFVIFILFSCSKHQDHNRQNAFGLKVIEARGILEPEDSLTSPNIITFDKNKLRILPAGRPKATPANANIHPALIPLKVVGLSPITVTPGKNTFTLPLVKPVIDRPFAAGIPEIVMVKEAYTKDKNSQNFSSFKKLQGLKHIDIRFLLEDRSGNLWLGTYGGGVSKYDGKSFTHYTVKEGLSNNDVLSILQDKNGNFWFGTGEGGVTKYDGKYFTHYTIKEGLSHNSVLSMLEDKNGNIWIGTNGGGVSKYDGKSFTQFTEKEGLSNNYVLSVLEDRQGHLWFGTNGGGVSMYDGRSFTHITKKEGLSNNVVHSMLEDKDGNLWFGTGEGGITKFDGKCFYRYSEKEGFSSKLVMSALGDQSGNLWFGTNGDGMIRFDGQSFTHYTENEGLSKNIVYSLAEDSRGTLWCGTGGGGVSKHDGKSFTHFTMEEGLPHNIVYAILKDSKGNLWFGTGGGGVSKYDGTSFTDYTEKEGLTNNYVWSIYEDKNKNLWFGTAAGVCKFDGKYFTHFYDEDKLFSYVVNCITEDRKGNLWFGTYGEGVVKYDGTSFVSYTEESGLSSNYITAITEDKSENLWFCTEGGGLTRYDGQHFTHFTEAEGFSNNLVLSATEDKNGNMWFGTYGGGVTRYDGKTFIQFTDKEGLSDNFVFSVLEDKKGDLWFGTRFGLSRMPGKRAAEISEDLRTNKRSSHYMYFNNFNYEDGFLGIGCFRNSICEDNNGNIWIGTNDRLTVYHPTGEIPDTIAPNIQLTGIELFNENIAWKNLENNKDSVLYLGNGVKVSKYYFNGISKWYNLPQELNLAYNNNYLTFHFIGITLKKPKKVKYQCKLEGNDENWSAINSRTEAPYGNLSPGTYTFKVKAMNSEEAWSKEYHYSFTIRPPWWQTWWFKTLVSLLAISLIVFYIKWRERTLKERQKVLEKTVEERTAEVVAEKKEVEIQKKRSDKLLLSILPEEVAEELKAKGSAEAQLFDQVSVLFADFKNFTQASEKLTPTELVTEINECFVAFDNIMEKYGIEKIKTIGDAYMAAGGLPTPNTTHALDVLHAAMDMQQLMKIRKEQKEQTGRILCDIRIGIHTGPVVAGIVGVKKFAYDIWGDTVNIASRMESSGEAGKINISGITYEMVKDHFICTYRGKVAAKHKDEIDMYFVDSAV